MPKRFVFDGPEGGPTDIPDIAEGKVEERPAEGETLAETPEQALTRVTTALQGFKTSLESAYDTLTTSSVLSNAQITTMKQAAIMKLVTDITTALQSDDKLMNNELDALGRSVETRLAEIRLTTAEKQWTQTEAEAVDVTQFVERITEQKEATEKNDVINAFLNTLGATNVQWLIDNETAIDEAQLTADYPLTTLFGEEGTAQLATQMATRLKAQIEAAKRITTPPARPGERPAARPSSLNHIEGNAAVNTALDAVAASLTRTFPRFPQGFPTDVRSDFDAAVTNLKEAKNGVDIDRYKGEAIGIITEAHQELQESAGREQETGNEGKKLTFGGKLKAISAIMQDNSIPPLEKLMKALKVFMTGELHSKKELAKIKDGNKESITQNVANLKLEYNLLKDKCKKGLVSTMPKNLHHVFNVVGQDIGISNPLENFISEGKIDSFKDLQDSYTAGRLATRAGNFMRIMGAIRSRIGGDGETALTWNEDDEQLYTVNEYAEVQTSRSLEKYKGYEARGENTYEQTGKNDIDAFWEDEAANTILLEKGDELVLGMKNKETEPMSLATLDLSLYQNYFGIQLDTDGDAPKLTLHCTALDEGGTREVPGILLQSGQIGIMKGGSFKKLSEHLANLEDSVIDTALSQDRVVVGGTEIRYLLPGDNNQEVQTLSIPQEWRGRLTESGGKIDIPDLSPELGNSFIEFAGSPLRFVLRKEGKEGYHILPSGTGKNPLDEAKTFLESEARGFNELKSAIEGVNSNHQLRFAHYGADGRVSLTINGIPGGGTPPLGRYIDLSLTPDNGKIACAVLWNRTRRGGSLQSSLQVEDVPFSEYGKVFNMMNSPAFDWGTFFSNGETYTFKPTDGDPKNLKFTNGTFGAGIAVTLQHGIPSIVASGRRFFLTGNVGNFKFRDGVSSNPKREEIWRRICSTGMNYNASKIESYDDTENRYSIIPGQNGVLYAYRQEGRNQRYRPAGGNVLRLSMNAGRIETQSDNNLPTIPLIQAFADIMIAELSHSTASADTNSWRAPDSDHLFLARDAQLITGNALKISECKFQLVDGVLYANKGTDVYKYETDSFSKVENALDTLPVDLLDIGQKFTLLKSRNSDEATHIRLDNNNFTETWQRVNIGGEEYACIREDEQNIVWKGDKAYTLTFDNNVYASTEITGELRNALPRPPAHIRTDAGAGSTAESVTT